MSIKVLKEKVYLGTATPETGGGQTINNEDIYVTSNGVYTAGEGYTGIGTATVDIPLGEKSITENGEFYASSDGLQGYSSVMVNVPEGDIVAATNATNSAIAEGDKVWLEKKISAGTRDFSTYNSQNFTLNDTTQIIDFGSSVGQNIKGSIYKSFASAFSTPSKIEMQCKIKASPNTQSKQIAGLVKFFGSSILSDYTANTPLISVGVTGKGLTVYYTSPISASLDVVIGESSIDINAWYWVKFVITSSSLIGYWSIDGINWTNFRTINTNYLSSFANVSKNYSINNLYSSSASYGGIVDLSETYVKADDSIYWWRPYLNSVIGWNILPYKYSSINSFSGFANETIAVNSTGNVKTILPEQVTVTVTASADNAEITAV